MPVLETTPVAQASAKPQADIPPTGPEAKPAKKAKAKAKAKAKPKVAKKVTKTTTKTTKVEASPKAEDRPTGPTRGTLRVLAAILAAGKSLAAEQIAEALGITRGSLSRHLTEAESLGYAKSSVGGPEADGDERAYRYTLTAAGRRLAEKAAKAAGSAKKATAKPLSLMNAAIQVCKSASAPLRCAEIFEMITKKGLWKAAAGKTPISTLSAALLRDSNSDRPRWKKTSPGHFALTALGKK
jgi:DNA-binding MarR family transcriptional regulator